MIKFYDPSGESHFGQASITRTTSVNGGLSLTGEVFAGDEVLNGLDYGWWLNFDNEKYVITYKKLSDDTNTIVFDAVQQFFWDFAKVALHSQYTGSHEYTFYLNQLFNGSRYAYNNEATVPAFEKENWGYKNKLSLFNDIMDQADVEFEVHNETVHIAKQIGSDLTSFVRKGINLSDLTEEMKISDFATYAKGYGAFKDQQDPSKGRLEVEYRSELAKQFGDLEMDPIVDERYTIANNLIAELKTQVDATYTVSMTMNIYDLENAGYPNYESPKVGDWILAIDEALNFKRKIRIIKLEEQFDVIGKRIGYTATCGDLSIVDQYTDLQGSLDSKIQSIQESIDSVATSANGKSSNYYGAKEPVNANEGDLWFDQSNSDPDKWSIKQWANGRWEQLTLNPGEVSAKVEVARKEAETAVNNAKSAADKADQLASKYDNTNSLANQALGQAVSAQSDASSAVSKADSAAVDSKDAKQIAGAVSQSYKTLTDGSTMTIAELEGGLAVKLTKTDLNGYAKEDWSQNQIKLTAAGINGTISSVKDTVDTHTTNINDLQVDSRGFKTQFDTVTDTLGKQTTDIGTLQASSKELSSNFDSLDSDNKTNQHNIGQLQASAETFNSTLMTVQTQVQNSAVGTNLLTGTGYHTVTGTGALTRGNLYNETTDDLLALFKGLEGQTITVSVDYEYSGLIAGSGHNRLGWEPAITTDTTTWFGTWYSPNNNSGSGRVSKTFVVPKNIKIVSASGQIQFSGSGTGTVSHLKLEKGSVATDWCANPADNATVTAVSSISQTIEHIQTTVRGKVDDNTYQSKIEELSNQITSVVGQVNNVEQSQITQLASDISFKVSKDGVINAINISDEGTQIYGSKLHITAATYIDNAIIKSAMIESIEAEKIRTGTLDANKVNVIHLNASNITAGVINGHNLRIDLNAGNVEFQAGRIHSYDNGIDININDKYISVANYANRVLISGGEIQMIQPNLFSRQATPYVRISNAGAGSSWGGATFWGRDFFVVTNGANDRGMFTTSLGQERFSGISGGKSNSDWQVTKIGGAERGVFISGGKAFQNGISFSPYIRVGHPGSNGTGMRGSNITIEGDYIYLKSPHKTSKGANAYIAPDGALIPSTSAAKYKTDIVRSFETEMGNKLLEVPVAHWKDKEEVLAKNLDSNAKDPETYFGMIADDLDDAGLNELVEYDDKGAVNGIQYDRVALAIIPLIRNYRDRITELENEVKEMKEA